MKLSQIKAYKMIRFVKRLGWVRRKTKGGHQVFINPETGKHTTIPTGKRVITKGTLANIIKQLGITREEFIKKF